jgi:3-oxoacyl-[acyl-carrier protein] reductase
MTPAPSTFAGKVALVTGGASGIGAAVVRRLDAEGCALVVVADVDAEKASYVARSCRNARPERVDVSEPAGIEAALDRAVADHGRVDVVVHAAGVDDPESKAAIARSHETQGPVDVLRGFPDASWRRLMAVNLDGTFHVLRAAVRAMRPRRSGAIVTIGSSAGFDTLVGYPAYAAAKAGVHALSQSVAKEVIAHGIRVNTVAPGPVDTPMAARTPAAVREALAASGAVGFATPEQLADTICYLASPGAANVVGAVLLSNGGRFTA